MRKRTAPCSGKMAAAVREHGEDAFRKIFRFYRRKNPPADLSEVLEFRPGEPRLRAVPLGGGAVCDRAAALVGLQPLRHWSAYHVDGFPGFLFIVNPFLPGWQHRWVRHCLKLYPRKPNVCNLDLHMGPGGAGDLWGSSHAQLRRKSSQRRSEKTLLEKLRWVTLGYHYQWDTKKYYKDQQSPFPAELAELVRCVALACGFPTFKAEAAILNYYHMDSSLGIHVDESELDHGSPLLSFSFGQSGIFLLGGPHRDAAPTPMMMHSGDIMVMSGASRLLYHAVPRILRHPGGGVLPPGLSEPPHSDDSSPLIEPCAPPDWQVCDAYLQTSRINVTVRQVLAEGGRFPEEGDGVDTEETPRAACHTEETPSAACHTEETPGAACHTEETPGAACHTEETPGAACHAEETPGAACHAEETPGAACHAEQTPGAACHTEQTPRAACHTEQTPRAACHTEETPRGACHTEETPRAACHTEETPRAACHTEENPRAACHTEDSKTQAEQGLPKRMRPGQD